MEGGESWTLSDPGNRQTRVDLARILCHVDCPNEKLQNDRWIIDLDPKLSEDERQIITADYRAAISKHRHGIRVLEAIIEQERARNKPERAQKLDENRAEAIRQLRAAVDEFLGLLDGRLIPVAFSDERATVFYMKTKADFLRYACECPENDDEKQNFAAEAEKCYKRAMELHRAQLGSPDALLFSTALNYSILLFDLLKRRDEAIEIAQQALDECLSVLKEGDEGEKSEISSIHQILRENIQAWTCEDGYA